MKKDDKWKNHGDAVHIVTVPSPQNTQVTDSEISDGIRGVLERPLFLPGGAGGLEAEHENEGTGPGGSWSRAEGMRGGRCGREVLGLLDLGLSLKENPALEDLNVSVWLLVERTQQ